MKVISFSLWGREPLYNLGALENALVAPVVYPGWVCRFYHSQTADPAVLEVLEGMEHVQLVRMEARDSLANMFWRFQPAFDPDVEVMISRDADSILNRREAVAVREGPDARTHIHKHNNTHTS